MTSIHVEKVHLCVMDFYCKWMSTRACHTCPSNPQNTVTDITVLANRKSPTGDRLTPYTGGRRHSPCFCSAAQLQSTPVGKPESLQRGRTSLKLCFIFIHPSSLMQIGFAASACSTDWGGKAGPGISSDTFCITCRTSNYLLWKSFRCLSSNSPLRSKESRFV